MKAQLDPNAHYVHFHCDVLNVDFNTEMKIAEEHVAEFNAKKLPGPPCQHCGQHHVQVAKKPKFSQASK